MGAIIGGLAVLLIGYVFIGFFVNMGYSFATDFDYDMFDDERALAYMVFWPVLLVVMIYKAFVWFFTTLPKSIVKSIGFTVGDLNLKDKLITKD